MFLVYLSITSIFGVLIDAIQFFATTQKVLQSALSYVLCHTQLHLCENKIEVANFIIMSDYDK